MTKAKAIEAAKAENAPCPIAVVNDPLAMAEDESGPYGYCPLITKYILFKNGKTEAIVHPDGTVEEVSDDQPKPLFGQRSF
jgi:hypothetical protein